MPELFGFYTPHDPVVLDCGSEMITKQAFKDECDINNILSQFSRTGIIEHVNNSNAQWLDLPDVMDFQQSLSIVAQASAAFDSLPSVVRDFYENDPARLLSALSDPAQHDKLREFGVIKPDPAAASPTTASPVEPATP